MSSPHLGESSVKREQTSNRPGVQECGQEYESIRTWSLEAPSLFAPPKPEGNPWTSLLDPLLKEDKLRCDAWKEEVQNLLIFAGLFSGVVTAFAVESYKNLQPDPNDIMIQLLAQIATRLDGPPNPNTTSASLQFNPSASSIRVNIFWFSSLVLSLTTVLMGIISLQWLREHQSYSNLSPREMYAVYNMRVQSLVKWHVDKIFTALPVLLQSALVLFLGGIIDFLLAFQNRPVVIPVSILIGIALTFLIATTLLPGLQIFALSFHISSSDGTRTSSNRVPASQCPYKSPQSHATRAILRPIWNLCHRLYSSLHCFAHNARHRLRFSSSPSRATIANDVYTTFISHAFDCLEGVSFDVAWVGLRDAYMRRVLGRPLLNDEFYLRGSWSVVPKYDLIQALQKQSYQDSTFASAYHCFNELSVLTLNNDVQLQSRDRHSGYLHGLLTDNEVYLPELFLLDAPDSSTNQSTSKEYPLKIINPILHQQNTFSFMSAHFFHDGGLPSAHRVELSLRIMWVFCQTAYGTKTSARKTKWFPSCLTLDADYRGVTVLLEHPYLFKVVASQVAKFISSVLGQLELEPSNPNSLLRNIPAQQYILPYCMQMAGFIACRLFENMEPIPDEPLDCHTRDAFRSTFSLIEELLNKEIGSWSTPKGHPSLLFYLSVMYMQIPFTSDTAKLDAHLCSLHSTMREYKRRTLDMGIADFVLEERLKTRWVKTESHRHDDERPFPFSAEWWSKMFASDPEVDPPQLYATSDFATVSGLPITTIDFRSIDTP